MPPASLTRTSNEEVTSMAGGKSATVRLAVLLIVLSLLAGCSSGTKGQPQAPSAPQAKGETADKKVYQWKMGTVYNDPASAKDFNSLGTSMQKFVDLVKERTNGRVVIKPYYSSLLGTNPQLFQQVQTGELEVYYGQPMASSDKRFGAWSIPYLFRSLDEVSKLACDPKGPVFELCAKWLAEHHAVLIGMGPTAMRGFANSKHVVTKPSDLRDLKVRIYEDPVVAVFWKGLCNAVPMAYSETYSALQTKMIDGLEFQATSIIGAKFSEVVKHYTDIDWQWVWGANIIVSEKAWNELPDDLKAIVKQAAVDACAEQGALEKQYMQRAYEELKKRGVQVTNLSDAEREEWVKYAKTLEPELKKAIGEQTFTEVVNMVESLRKTSK